METDNKKQKDLLVIGILFILIILVSSAYAWYHYRKTLQAFTLRSQTITATFTPGSSNEINMGDAYPISDEYALSNLENLSYIDFTVSGNAVSPNEAVQYEIYLTEKTGNTLNSDYVKVYLTDNNNNIMSGPSIYSSLENTTYNKDATSGKVIYVDNELGEFTKNYRLYVWLDKDYSDNTASRTFSFYVNLYAYNLNRPLGKYIASKVSESYISSYTTNFPSFSTQDKYLDNYERKTVYYYNGASTKDNGNVLFAGYCWQIVRTTDTGGVKLLYNGVAENNQCSDSRTSKKGINSTNEATNITGLGSTSVYGTGFTYDANGFTLTGVMTGKSWATDSESLIGTYTCKGTNTTCETISYIGRYVNTTTGYGSTYQIGDLLDKYTVGISPFSPNYTTPVGVGYMYNKMYLKNDGTKTGDYGATATWNGSSYVLSDTNNQTSATIERRYVCDTDCTKVRYYYYADSSNTTYRYVLLENGKGVNDLLYEMLNYKTESDITNNKADATLNVYSSAIKRYLESWYNQNLKSYESLIDKSTVYCNDRTIITIGSWDPASSGTTTALKFKNYTANTGDLRCNNIQDRFSTENDRAKIDAPIGLLTEPERHLMGAAYAGDGVMNGESMTYYWGLSPYVFGYYNAVVRLVASAGATDDRHVYGAFGVRPTVTLRADAVYSGGNGSKTNPYVIGEKVEKTIS